MALLLDQTHLSRPPSHSCHRHIGKYPWQWTGSWPTPGVEPMLFKCWTSVCDAGPTFKQHRITICCFLYSTTLPLPSHHNRSWLTFHARLPGAWLYIWIDAVSIVDAAASVTRCASIGLMFAQRSSNCVSPILPWRAQTCIMSPPPRKTRDVDPMLVWCWTTVYNAGSTLSQHWLNASCRRWPLQFFNTPEISDGRRNITFVFAGQKNEMNRALGHYCAHTG